MIDRDAGGAPVASTPRDIGTFTNSSGLTVSLDDNAVPRPGGFTSGATVAIAGVVDAGGIDVTACTPRLFPDARFDDDAPRRSTTSFAVRRDRIEAATSRATSGSAPTGVRAGAGRSVAGSATGDGGCG